MITVSSNFAANLLIEKLGADEHPADRRRRSARTACTCCAGVEDQKAFDKGLNNTTTARGLLVLLDKLAHGPRGRPAGRRRDDRDPEAAEVQRRDSRPGCRPARPSPTRPAPSPGSITTRPLSMPARPVHARGPRARHRRPEAERRLISQLSRLAFKQPNHRKRRKPARVKRRGSRRHSGMRTRILVGVAGCRRCRPRARRRLRPARRPRYKSPPVRRRRAASPGRSSRQAPSSRRGWSRSAPRFPGPSPSCPPTSTPSSSRVRSSRGSIPSFYESQLDAARGQLAQATAEASQMQTALDDAKRKLTRARGAGGPGADHPGRARRGRDHDAAGAADVRARQAAIQSARAGVKQAEVDLDRTVIRSPIDGIVVNRNVDVGQTDCRDAAVAGPLHDCRPPLDASAHRSQRRRSRRGQPRLGGLVPIESLGPRTFHGTVADVRLQPYAEQAGAVATAGTAGAAGLTAVSTTGSSGTPVPLRKYQLPDGIEHRSRRVYRIGASGQQRRTTAPPASAYRHESNCRPPRIVASCGRGPALSPTRLSSTCRTPTDVLAPGSDGHRHARRRLPSGCRPRLPNNALSFRPSPAMLERTGQADLTVRNGAGEVASSDRNAHVSQVWQFREQPVRAARRPDRAVRRPVDGSHQRPRASRGPARDERRRQIALRILLAHLARSASCAAITA